MDGNALRAAYNTLKSGTLWSGTGKCKGYATANPGEAAKVDTYIYGLADGGSPTAPTLATATGKGFVGVVEAMRTTPTVPPIPPPPAGERPAAFWTGPLGINNLVPPVGKAYHGSMFGGMNYSLAMGRAQIAQRQQAMGRHYGVIQNHYDGSLGQIWPADKFGPETRGMQNPFVDNTGSSVVPPTKEEFSNANGSEVLSTWTPSFTIEQMARGDADSVWEKAARYYASLAPQRIVIRAFHEFDLPALTYRIRDTWDQNPDTFRVSPALFHDVWRRMVEKMHAIAPNVGFMWCPTEGALADRSILARYYPGDAWVDLVATDWYNTGGWATPLHDGWATFRELFDYAALGASGWSQYDIYCSGKAVSGQKQLTLPPHTDDVKLPTQKPFFVGETSTYYTTQKPNWWREVPAALKAMPNCVGVSWYDCDVHTVGDDFDWRVTSNAAVRNVLGQEDPATLLAFVEMARDPIWV